MRKIFPLLFAVITIASLFLYSSCKKTQHATNPTPANYRILSYSKHTDTVAHNDIYTFSYDANNRVSQIIYTTNDSSSVKHTVSSVGTRSVFTYSNDSIYKKITVLQTGALIDTAIFIKNSSGQIITAYLTGDVVQFEYYGKLLVRRTDKYSSKAGASISAVRTYTSDNADFLAWAFDGTLTANFPNADTNPFIVDWEESYGLFPVVHTVNTYSDVLANYTLIPFHMNYKDAVGHMDTVYFPGGYRLKESYGVFPDKDNRPGDYMHIESFTMFGVDIYQQAHLTRSVTNSGYITNITYDIDADSKITTTYASVRDSLGFKFNESYKFQYETF